MNTTIQIIHTQALQAAQETIAHLRDDWEVSFAGPTQHALTTLVCMARAGEWADHVPVIGQPDIRLHHLLDHLATSYALIPEEVTYISDPLGVCTVAGELPTCHRCTSRAARYDTWANEVHPAMFLCETCASPETGRSLGPGTATYILAVDEVPGTIRDICDQVTDELGRESIWST